MKAKSTELYRATGFVYGTDEAWDESKKGHIQRWDISKEEHHLQPR